MTRNKNLKQIFALCAALLFAALITACDPNSLMPPSSTGGSKDGLIFPINTQPSSSGSASVPVKYPALPSGLKSAQVVKVVDGDTIDVSLNGQTQRVRMIGINTPETVDPRRVVQCFGIEASNRAKQLLTGQTVLLESDPTQGNTDQYGRLLLYIWFSDGRMFNLQMLAEGFANEYTYNIPYKYQNLFKSTARAADQAQVGLWSPQTCNGDFNSPTKTP